MQEVLGNTAIFLALTSPLFYIFDISNLHNYHQFYDIFSVMVIVKYIVRFSYSLIMTKL